MRPLFLIADEISLCWKKPYFGAVPYLDAMKFLSGPGDNFGLDSGKEIVLYFLANAKRWTGDDARRIKAELKGIVGI
jgi:hypothetical protein